jgi:hypothetical protein
LKLDQIGTGLAPECATRRKAFDFHGFMQHLTITSNGSGPEPLPNYSRAEKFGSKTNSDAGASTRDGQLPN